MPMVSVPNAKARARCGAACFQNASNLVNASSDSATAPALLPADEMLNRMLAAGRKGFLRRRWRGPIWDYARTIWLGPGYLGDWALTNLCRTCRARGLLQCRHFEIDTARHLMGPFRAIHDPNVRIVMLLKAAQTAGSLVWDLAVHFLLVHSSYMRVKVLMDSDEKARVYCTQRLMETLKANPDIAPLLPTGADRFGVTDTELRLLNGKTLFVGGLNDRNASSLPADVMILDEGWLHQSDGLLKKAFERLKQTKHGKIIIVGQAGKVDEDQDVIWKSLHVRVPLTFACPCCGGRQEFSLTGQRPADFVPRLPKVTIWDIVKKHCGPMGIVGNYKLATNGCNVQLPAACLAELEAARAALAERVKPETYWGMKVPERFSDLDTPEKIKAAAARTTLECYHCGFEIPDTRQMRLALNNSFEQQYQQRAPDGTWFTPPDYSVGFWQPDPASMFVPFKNTMETYIIAKQSNKLLGNVQKLIDFYQANWATPWDENLLGTTTATAPMNIFKDDEPVAGELVRMAQVDIQDNLTNVWVQIWAVGAGSALRLLYWAHVVAPLGLTLVERREFCKNECRKLFQQYKVQPQNVKIDLGHMPELIFEWAAEDHIPKAELKHRDGRTSHEPVFYGLVRGDDAKGYKHKVRGNKYVWAGFSPKFYEQIILTRGGQREAIKVPYRLMSTERTQRVAQRFIEQNGAPKLEIPPQYLADKTLLGLWAQLNSEHEVPERGKKVWKQIHQRPNHGRDCFRMALMRMEECGLLVFAGAVEPVSPAGDEGKGE